MMENDRQDRHFFYGLTLDGYIPASSMLDECSRTSLQVKLSFGSEAMVCFYEHCQISYSKKSFVDLVENAAKALSNMAKRRLLKDFMSQLLLPFFVSLDMFNEVGNPTRSKLPSTYNYRLLCNRFLWRRKPLMLSARIP